MLSELPTSVQDNVEISMHWKVVVYLEDSSLLEVFEGGIQTCILFSIVKVLVSGSSAVELIKSFIGVHQETITIIVWENVIRNDSSV